MIYVTLLLTIIIISIYILSAVISRGKQLVKRLQLTKKRKRGRLFKYDPSSALIDQLLPLEILSNIIGSNDIEFLRNCRRVSKYWNGVASTISPQHFFKQLPTRPFNIEKLEQQMALKIDWLEYPTEWYDLQWLYEDAVLAQQRGKKIIDANLESANGIAAILRAQDQPKKYLAKVRAPYQKQESVIYVLGNGSIILKWYADRNADPEQQNGIAEIIIELEHLTLPLRLTHEQIYRFRKLPIASVPKIGMLPRGRALAQTLGYAYMPSIVSDIMHLLFTSVYFSLAQQIIGSAVIISMLLLLLGYMMPYQSETKKLIWLICAIINVVIACFIGSSGMFFDFTNFAAYCIIICSYEYIIEDLANRNRYSGNLNVSHPDLLRIFCFGVIFLTVDWSTAIGSIINGSIWQYLIRNMVYATELSAFYLFSQYIRWNRKLAQVNTSLTWSLIIRLYIIGVFYTLYLPV